MKTIIWDFDGTLANRPYTWSSSILAALDELAPNHGVELMQIREHTAKNFPWHQPEKDFLHLKNPDAWWAHLESVIHATVALFVSDASQRQLVVKRARGHIVDASRYPLFPDAVPTLQLLTDRGWRHVILSNNYPDLPEIVDRLEIRPFIQRVFTSALIGYEKPRREIYDYVREQIGSPELLWMIGDSESADALGAEAAGIPAILVRHKNSKFHRQARDLAETAKIILESNR